MLHSESQLFKNFDTLLSASLNQYVLHLGVYQNTMLARTTQRIFNTYSLNNYINKWLRDRDTCLIDKICFRTGSLGIISFIKLYNITNPDVNTNTHFPS